MSNHGWRITGKILKYVALVFVFSVTGLIIWRMLSSGDPKSMSAIMVNENTFNAYDSEKDTLDMYYQNQNSITRGEDNYGYFAVTWVAVIPEAHQIQIVFRYNNSTLKSVASDMGLDAVPGRDENIFDVTIAVSTDLTPDKDTDNDYSASEHPEAVSEKRYYPSEMISDTKTVYNYRKFIFDGIDIDKDTTLAVYVDIFFRGSDSQTVVDYSKTPYGVLCIYDYASADIKREFSAADRDAILDWKKKNGR